MMFSTLPTRWPLLRCIYFTVSLIFRLEIPIKRPLDDVDSPWWVSSLSNMGLSLILVLLFLEKIFSTCLDLFPALVCFLFLFSFTCWTRALSLERSMLSCNIDSLYSSNLKNTSTKFNIILCVAQGIQNRVPLANSVLKHKFYVNK